MLTKVNTEALAHGHPTLRFAWAALSEEKKILGQEYVGCFKSIYILYLYISYIFP